jgi:hypothetical protein
MRGGTAHPVVVVTQPQAGCQPPSITTCPISSSPVLMPGCPVLPVIPVVSILGLPQLAPPVTPIHPSMLVSLEAWVATSATTQVRGDLPVSTFRTLAAAMVLASLMKELPAVIATLPPYLPQPA